MNWKPITELPPMKPVDGLFEATENAVQILVWIAGSCQGGLTPRAATGKCFINPAYRGGPLWTADGYSGVTITKWCAITPPEDAKQ